MRVPLDSALQKFTTQDMQPHHIVTTCVVTDEYSELVYKTKAQISSQHSCNSTQKINEWLINHLIFFFLFFFFSISFPFFALFSNKDFLESNQSPCLKTIPSTLNWGVWLSPCECGISWTTAPLLIWLHLIFLMAYKSSMFFTLLQKTLIPWLRFPQDVLFTSPKFISGYNHSPTTHDALGVIGSKAWSGTWFQNEADNQEITSHKHEKQTFPLQYSHTTLLRCIQCKKFLSHDAPEKLIFTYRNFHKSVSKSRCWRTIFFFLS